MSTLIIIAYMGQVLEKGILQMSEAECWALVQEIAPTVRKDIVAKGRNPANVTFTCFPLIEEAEA